MLEISNNSTSIYRSCPKKYYWRYLRGLVPFKRSTALSLGSIVHSAFDMYYNKFSVDEVTDFIIKTSDEEIAKAPPEAAEGLVLVKYTALAMWLNYPKDLSRFSDIKPELELRIKMPGMRGVDLVMKIDGLVKIDGKFWIRELKTTGMSFGQFEKRCETSPQCSLYTYAVRKAGYPVEGIIYDFVKKPMLRRHVRESKDDFGRRISASYKERPEFYYKRHPSYRSQETLDLFEEDLRRVTREIRTRCRKCDWYRNPDSCWNFNSACSYLPICFQKEPDNLTIDVFFEKKPINITKGGTDGSRNKGKSSTRKESSKRSVRSCK